MGQDVESSKDAGAERAWFRVACAALFILSVATFAVATDVIAIPGITRDNPDLASRVGVYAALAIFNLVGAGAVWLVAHEAAR